MRRTWRLGGMAAAGLLVLMAARPAMAERHTDEQLGYSVNVPQGYRAIPIAGDEKYVVAKWQSEREYTDPKEGWSGYRPEIRVILFDPKGKATGEAKENADGSISLRVENPYRNYQEWIKSDASGGRYISKEEETKVGDVPTTWYEVAYEKLTVPRHGIAFVYHAADIDYCVTVEVLEQNWDKLSPALVQMLKSFKIFPRKGTVKREVTDSDDIVVRKDRSKMTPEERFAARKEALERAVRIATERLTKGWEVKRSKNFVAISHCDAKYTATVLEQAEAVRTWLDANLAFFGDGIPAPEIIRICKDTDEERSFKDISAKSGSWSQEITVSKNEGAWGFGWLADTIFDRWLDDKNPRLRYSLPPWLRQGLSEWIRSAYVKGGKLVFRADGDLVIALRVAAKEKSLIPPKEMVQITDAEMIEREKAASPNGPSVGGMPIPGLGGQRTSPWMQAGGLVRFLLDGPGKSDKRGKDLLRSYVQALDQYVKEEDEKSPDTKGKEGPKTEEEEDEEFKNREKFWKEHEKELLKTVFERAFRDWTDADWEPLERSYRNFAK